MIVGLGVKQGGGFYKGGRSQGSRGMTIMSEERGGSSFSFARTAA